MHKTYVLDTNVLMDDPNAILNFDEHEVVLLHTVFDELEKGKGLKGARGANAQAAVKLLNEISRTGDLYKGLELPSGGILRVTIPEDFRGFEKRADYDIRLKDDEILFCCETLKDKEGKNVILVSNDVVFRLRALNNRGIKAEEYRTYQVPELSGQYTGRRDVYFSSEEVDRFYTEGGLLLSEDISKGMFKGEFISGFDINNPKHSFLAKFDGEKAVPLCYVDEFEPDLSMMPRNAGQRFALEALLAPADEVPLVILRGPAGSAKTFVSLAGGLARLLGKERLYEKILAIRPQAKLDGEIGFLPGDEKEKVDPLMRPIYGNLDKLTRVMGDKRGQSYTDYLLGAGMLEVQSFTYLRGQSIDDAYIIIDEGQNMTPIQAFSAVSRAGVGTKIVITGDPEQIDVPGLDARTNGLSFAVERMKDSPLCQVVAFADSECVRSMLSREAVQKLSPKSRGLSVTKHGL